MQSTEGSQETFPETHTTGAGALALAEISWQSLCGKQLRPCEQFGWLRIPYLPGIRGSLSPLPAMHRILEAEYVISMETGAMIGARDPE